MKTSTLDTGIRFACVPAFAGGGSGDAASSRHLKVTADMIQTGSDIPATGSSRTRTSITQSARS